MPSRATTTPAPSEPQPRHGDRGFALVEILVSALVVVAVSGGALAALQASNHSGSEDATVPAPTGSLRRIRPDALAADLRPLQPARRRGP